MNEPRKRILFLCALASPRSLMAASVLTALARETWDIWCTPITSHAQDINLVQQVLDESSIPFLLAPQITEPRFDLVWDTGVVLCSGAADQ